VSIDLTRARVEYRTQFARAPEIITRAPGRVNIIGEHTDYNHGFVLPMAIEHETAILACPRADLMLNAYAANLKRAAEADLTRRVRDPRESWMDYVVGVADEVAKLGKPLRGADVMIIGDVPIGCGLSSSASLEMAALCLFEALGGFEVEGTEAPRLGQRVENLFLGLSTGIMDQFVSRMGKRGHALFLDCRSFEYELIPVAFPGSKFVIANTCLARGLTSSKYNERVAECKEAVEGMAGTLGKKGTHLRDFTMDDLLASRARLPEVAFRRARHVISEDIRTKAACEAMRAGDAAALGRLMNGSDASLRDDYEVTCPELDAMAEIARSLPGCHGARMTGAGFGGCTINLVQSEAVPSFAEKLMEAYTHRTGITGQTFISVPADGAARMQ
jgi:galactokinase